MFTQTRAHKWAGRNNVFKTSLKLGFTAHNIWLEQIVVTSHHFVWNNSYTTKPPFHGSSSDLWLTIIMGKLQGRSQTFQNEGWQGGAGWPELKMAACHRVLYKVSSHLVVWATREMRMKYSRYPKILLEGNIHGSSPRGRPDKKWLEDIKSFCLDNDIPSFTAAGHLSQNREHWKRALLGKPSPGVSSGGRL